MYAMISVSGKKARLRMNIRSRRVPCVRQLGGENAIAIQMMSPMMPSPNHMMLSPYCRVGPAVSPDSVCDVDREAHGGHLPHPDLGDLAARGLLGFTRLRVDLPGRVCHRENCMAPVCYRFVVTGEMGPPSARPSQSWMRELTMAELCCQAS